MQLKLSDLVVPWIKEKKFPVSVYQGGGKRGIWYIDLHDDNVRFKRAMAAIVDDTNPPYVVVLNSAMRPTIFFHPAEPDFLEKFEAVIKQQVEFYGKRSDSK